MNPAARGMFTGKRGCLVDGGGAMVRHHRGNLWITCLLRFRGRRVRLTRANRWTPLFFLDDAVALAAGHRPCGECRHADYRAFRDAVGSDVRAPDLDRMLAAQRLRRGRGLARGGDRHTWTARSADLPDGAVVLTDGPRLVLGARLHAFFFDGWHDPVPRPAGCRSARALRSSQRPPHL